ncbi:response regulator [Flavisolibacter sp. BT320]|nr:response regulator [Flavisolibacter longurius]
MNKNGPIIVIEDDTDDQDILTEIFKKQGYPNEIIFFVEPEKALHYLNHMEVLPFLILSDINMPKLNGLALKRKIHTDAALQAKCIPYLFFTTTASKGAVIEAYSSSAQGFFIKERSMAELEKTINIIIEYWQRCYAPNHYDE